jgi:predicted nucleic acid-binding protein
LVDSSVWIDYLSLETSKIGSQLETFIRPSNKAVITGVIFQEVLQGIRNRRSYQLTKKLMHRLPFLLPHAGTHVKAAEIFRDLVSRGKKPSTVDVLIAALAIEHRIPLFTMDSDFRFIEAHSALKLFI